MSTHKHFDKICCILMAIVLAITGLFMNGEALGIQTASRVMGYENRLFDHTRVHTIDLVVNGWEEFLETCTDEEYIECAAVIDGEAYKNIAIRAKGNTSLSSVRTYGNDRYSFKLEFDHYDSSLTYHGLDKLCLNNIIQDNTYMKDFLVYRMMNKFGVSAPLCSFAYITVNGEDRGLYLAVEAVEESFLQRNYGADYGELYKPDSMSFGGGRGNGAGFDMEEFRDRYLNENGEMDFETIAGELPEQIREALPEDFDPSQITMPDGFDPSQFGGMGGFGGFGGGRTETGAMPQGMTPPEIPEGTGSSESSGFAPPEIPENGGTPPDMNSAAAPEAGGAPAQGETETPEASVTGTLPEAGGADPMQNGRDNTSANGDSSDSTNGIAAVPVQGGFGGMGSDDVKLRYIDDDPDSYPNIFNSAKTDVSDADKERLISSLKKLSEGDTSAVSMDEVLRYLVVHIFVCNGDSYTGNMIHNYYLYEEDGLLSMLPWDYNLAFGAFDGGQAAATVNAPIDTPVSGGIGEDRPMVSWIFSDEEYTAQYHEYFDQFISELCDSGWITELIGSTAELIAPYVEKDPTKFCTYEEFEKGVEALREFVLLRAESVSGQLDGTIPSTAEGQSGSAALVDASHISLSDMGSMGDMGGGFGGRENGGSSERGNGFGRGMNGMRPGNRESSAQSAAGIAESPPENGAA